MQNLDNLLNALANFEEHADRAERKAAIPALQRLARRLEIRSLELAMQRQMLASADCAGDKQILRDLLEHSEHEEIQSWCAEILNLKPPRTLSCQRIQL